MYTGKSLLIHSNAKSILFFTTLVTILLFVTAGCNQTKTARTGKLKVVATVGMIADAARIIAGDKVEVTGLMGAGVDPHLYKASKGDVDALDNADLILYNGLNLEAKMTEIFEKMKAVKPTAAVSETIDTALLRHPPEFQGHPDPHVWFDVSMWKKSVEAIGAALAVNDTINRQFYAANVKNYLDTLESLHGWVKEQIATIPADKRVLVTAHDAFGYFGRAYSIEVFGLQGISTVTEAGLYDFTHMIDLLVLRKIKAVFVESSVPRKAIEAVVEGCRGRGHDVKIGGTLFSDAMGDEGTPEGSYVGMVRYNVNAIVNALK